MARVVILANEESDVDALDREIRSRFEAVGANPSDIELIASQAQTVLSSLVNNGRLLAGQGSQLSVEREISAGENSLNIKFGAGVPRSAWKKFLDRLRGL